MITTEQGKLHARGITTTTPATAFGEALRAHRVAAGLSQSELARRIGCNATMVSRIESGTRRPSPETVTAITAALGLPADEAAYVTALCGHWPACLSPSDAAWLVGRRGYCDE